MHALLFFFSRATIALLALVAPVIAVAQTYTPVSVTGFNRDIVADIGFEHGTAESFDIVDSSLEYPDPFSFHAKGYRDVFTSGLPGDNIVISKANSNITFGLADYAAQNVLFLTNNAAYGLTSGTLTLATPTRFSHLAILATSAQGGGVGGLTLHFSDGPDSSALTYNAPDWFSSANSSLIAYEANGRASTSFTSIQETSENDSPYLYQTEIDLESYGYDDLFITAITFDLPSGGGADMSTAIFAVSGTGISAIPEPSTYAVLAGLGVLGLALYRRRR